MRPVKISLAGEYVDKLKPGVLLVERELHGSLKGIAKKSKIVEPGQGQGQQVVGGCRKFVSRREKKKTMLFAIEQVTVFKKINYRIYSRISRHAYKSN